MHAEVWVHADRAVERDLAGLPVLRLLPGIAGRLA